MRLNLSKYLTKRGAPGFSLVEMLVVIAGVSTACALGVVAVSKTRQAGQNTKLEVDVAAINRSLQIYLANGGTLPKKASAQEVLDHLKTKTIRADAVSIVGHTDSFIDGRLDGIEVGKKKGALRAVWDRKKLRFEVAANGEGISEFVLDDKLGANETKTENRQTVQKFAKRDAWVWDYDGDPAGVTKVPPAEAAVAAQAPAAFAAQAAGGPQRLQPPQFSVPGGLHEYADFPMPVQLINPNPAGSSSILYSLNNGISWSTYVPGSPPTLPQNQFNTMLQAYSASTNSEKWVDSANASNLYQTIFFQGSTSGLFHDPQGDANQETNLPPGVKLKTFTWGKPVYKSSKNSLDFKGVNSFFAVPEQEFKIGDLTYINGTTLAGTNSTSVEMEVSLNLTVPQATERLDFSVKLKSTPNLGKDQNIDADYVWIPKLFSKFSTAVQGQTFYLQLRFGTPSVSSFTTIDEFHVYESKSASGGIYGTLTTKPGNDNGVTQNGSGGNSGN